MIFSSVFFRNCIFMFFKNLISIYTWKSLPPSKEMSPEKCENMWMNFWVIISYLKVKNLSRKSGFEKCKKSSKNHLSKVSPGRQKEQKQQLQNNKTKTTNNPKWGLWGLLYLLLIGNLIFVVERVNN